MGDVIQFPRRYECHCGARDRQDCYCWDRRPHRGRTWGIAGILAALAGFWGGVLYLIFRWAS